MTKKEKKIMIVITGLPGSGKTSIAKEVRKKLEKVKGPSIVVNGDDIRNIFDFKGYSIDDRNKLALPYYKFAKFIINQRFNVILTCVTLSDKDRKEWKRKSKPIFVHINSKLKNRIQFKKRIYSKNKKNIPGINQRISRPKVVDLKIQNDYETSIADLSLRTWKKIQLFLN